MKKLFYPLFGLAALAMTGTSCQDELDNGGATNGNEAVVSFKVQLENETGSRAVGDGTSAKYLAFAVYKKAENDTIQNEVKKLRQDNIEVDAATLTATVTTRLVKGQTYNFIFWAQNEKTNTGTEETPVYKGTYYDVTDLRKIQVVYTDADASEDKEDLQITANEEKRDAFYAVEKALKITGPINETITLKRPFAQVNVGTKIGSLAEAATAETTITKSKMVIKGVATMLYPYSGRVSHAKDVTYTSANIPESNHTDAAGDLKDVTIDNVTSDYEYLSMNYMLVDDQNMDGTKPADGSRQGIVSADLTLYAGTEAINTFEIPNIPVQRNWRTNIIGDILNETVTFNIVIDPNFDNDHNYDIAKKLEYAFANGGEVTLDATEYTLDKPMTLGGGKTVVLNLNGATIKTSKGADAFVVNDGTLTIKGEGTITTEDKTAGYAVIADGAKAVVNIYGGTYTIGVDDLSKEGMEENIAANSAVYTKNGGMANIYGGTYKVSTQQTLSDENKTRFLLNKNGTPATAGGPIVVYGGKFEKFNPADNLAESPKESFVATSYKSVANGDWYEVFKESCATVSTTEDFKTAVSNGQDIALLTDVDLSAQNSTPLSIEKPITIDLNGKTLTTNATYSGINLKNGASIKNGTVKHDGKTAAIKAFQVETIENVTIEVTTPNPNGNAIGGIVIQQGAETYIGSLKNVTIKGAGLTNGIETYNCGNTGRAKKVIGNMENVNIDATDTGMILSAPVGIAKSCNIKGGNYGINMHLKGEYTVEITLQSCEVTGGKVGLWAHDEVGIPNTTKCSLTLTYDAATIINKGTEGDLKWDFEEECKSVVKLNKP